MVQIRLGIEMHRLPFRLDAITLGFFAVAISSAAYSARSRNVVATFTIVIHFVQGNEEDSDEEK